MSGRLLRLCMSIPLGIALALLIMSHVPRHSLSGYLGGDPLGGANPILIGAAACGLALAINALLAVAMRRLRTTRPVIPRAMVRPPRR
ncbi:MAG TPA: hypothetical protein VIV40_08495 [Kofleriaceae bacterium]